jgi:RRXRR protein
LQEPRYQTLTGRIGARELAVFVLDKRKKPLMPCSEKRARQLLEHRRAVVHKMYPFTIRLKDRVGGVVQPVQVKLDPGSKTTGIAVIREERGNKPAKVLCLFELTHRGDAIQEKLTAQRGYRRRRCYANSRYREDARARCSLRRKGRCGCRMAGADAQHQGYGTRHLLPDQGEQARHASRRLHAHEACPRFPDG